MRRSIVRWVSFALTPLLLAGCIGPFQGTPARESTLVPDVTQSPQQAAERLASALATAKTLDEARPLVREILARNGVKVQTKSGELRAQPMSPALDIWYFDFQADSLAQDQLGNNGFTLDQLSQCMSEVPTEGAGFWADPQVLREFTRQLVLAAKSDPTDPRAFGPLLLGELAARHNPPVDLTDASVDPRKVPVTYLEMLVLTLVVKRGVPDASTTGQLQRPNRAASALADPTTVAGVAERPWWSRPVPFLEAEAYAADSNPCSWLEGAWGKDVKDFINAGVGKGIDDALEKAGKAATKSAGKAAKTAAKTGAGAFGYVTALVSLVATMGGYSLEVKPEPAKAHYYGTGPEHGNNEVAFVAHVSSKPVADKDLQSCLDWVGVELPDEKSAQDAIVRWVPLYGLKTYGEPEHGQVLKKGLNLTAGGGRLEQKVDGDGSAKLSIAPSLEKKSGLKKTGKLKKDKILVQAELFVQNPNGGKIAGMVLFGGVPDALKAWADKWFPKKAMGTMPIEWHEPKQYKFKKTEKVGPFDVTVEGVSEAGLYGRWDVTWTAIQDSSGVQTTMKLTEEVLTSDAPGSKGLLKGEGTMTQVMNMDGLTGKRSGKMTARGTATIGGTDDNPTITLTMTEFNVAGTGSGSADGESYTDDFNISGAKGRMSGKGSLKASSGSGGFSASKGFKDKASTYSLEAAE